MSLRRHSIYFFTVSVLLMGLIAASCPAWAFPYTVQPGDTFYKLSQRFGVSMSALQKANNNWSGYLEVGQVITIPDPSPSSGSGTTYTVKPGDSLYLIAQRFGTTVAALMSANNLSHSEIYPGQVLTIPRTSSGSGKSGSGQRYTVQYGDTLYLIAQRFGTTVAALMSANNLSRSEIHPGQVLIIPASSGAPPNPSTPRLSLTWNEKDLVARLVRAEAEAEPFEGQVAVAATVFNRLKDPRYPKNVTAVIYQKVHGYYQYEPVQNGTINQPANALSLRAVELALNGWDPSLGATGFYNPAKVSPTSWVLRQPVTVVIGNHVFIKP
ncbi:MAG: LysM peptidoglycan-binding domain-containing protein [Limnochordales bacterium]|nr:LysM peptidoglycan-binding domain-containing protein [Limnochordales bacterium]